MFVIGLTGSFGTGKSTVAGMFKSLGCAIIDADAITRGLLEKNGKCYKKVAKIFPDAILTSLKVNRTALANIVFNDPRKLKKLTDILYPEALKKIKSLLGGYRRKDFVVLDVPLLFESGWDHITDLNITVAATQKEQLKRLKLKWGITLVDINKRIKSQYPLSVKKQLADIVINNNGSINQTQAQVVAVLERLKRIRKKGEGVHGKIRS